jgi:hypothetical protein
VVEEDDLRVEQKQLFEKDCGQPGEPRSRIGR